MAQAIPLPKATTAVRLEHGRLLVHEGTALKVFGLDGATVQTIDTSARVQRFRRITVDDAAPLPDGSVAAYVNGGLALGETVFGILRWMPARSEPEWFATGKVQCAALATGAESGLWCLGVDRGCLVQGANCAMLHRLTPAGVESHVPWKSVGWKREVDEYARLPWQTSSLGSPAVFGPVGGAVFVWAPSAEAVVRFDIATRQVKTWGVPPRPEGRAITSMTVTPGGRVIGLFPLERIERLDGRYGFYELDQVKGEWRSLPKMGTLDRGIRIVGSTGTALYVWDRTRQVVGRRPL